jgi:hypothetical protein
MFKRAEITLTAVSTFKKGKLTPDCELLVSPFSISSSEGDIYPSSETQFVITFFSLFAGFFETETFCNVSGRKAPPKPNLSGVLAPWSNFFMIL